MSKIKNGGLDQYGAEPFEQQQFGTAGVEGVNAEIHANRLASQSIDTYSTIYKLLFLLSHSNILHTLMEAKQKIKISDCSQASVCKEGTTQHVAKQ